MTITFIVNAFIGGIGVSRMKLVLNFQNHITKTVYRLTQNQHQFGGKPIWNIYNEYNLKHNEE